MGRKHCGKRRNCSSRAISPFPTVFSKDFYCRHVKTRACLGKGYIYIHVNYNFHHDFWMQDCFGSGVNISIFSFPLYIPDLFFPSPPPPPPNTPLANVIIGYKHCVTNTLQEPTHVLYDLSFRKGFNNSFQFLT